MSDTSVAVAGVLYVGPMPYARSGQAAANAVNRANGASGATAANGIWVGPAAGWRAPRGIHQWERELSFVPRASMTAALASALRATLPAEQIAPKRFPMAAKAVEASPLLGISSNLTQAVQEQGARVHTIGVDRVSGDFFYFEEGGKRDPLRVQGSLVDMLGPSIGAATTNAEIALMMDGLLDRLLLALSEGEVSELDVELADALPRLSRDGTGLVGTDLEAFEAEAKAMAARAERWSAAAREIPEALAVASRRGKTSTAVPLFGEATKETKPALDLVLGGKPFHLSPQPIWTVRGAPRAEEKPAARPAPSPAVTPAPSPTSTPSPEAPRVTAKAEPKSDVRAEAKKAETRRTPSPAPVRVAAKTEARVDTIPPPGPIGPRMPSNVDTIPLPKAVLSHVSDRPPRVSPVPAPPGGGTKPTPLKTPVPPRPATESPLVSRPTPTPAPTPAPAPALAPALASETASASAPETASASASAPETASTSASDTATAPPAAPPLPIVPSVASSATRVPVRKPSATFIVVMFALLAIAYVAFKSFP